MTAGTHSKGPPSAIFLIDGAVSQNSLREMVRMVPVGVAVGRRPCRCDPSGVSLHAVCTCGRCCRHLGPFTPALPRIPGRYVVAVAWLLVFRSGGAAVVSYAPPCVLLP